MTNRYRPKTENTAATVIDGEAVIVNLTTGVYYSMDKVGAEVWEMIEQGYSLDQISADVTARYDVAHAKATADVEALAARLVAEDLMEPLAEAEIPETRAVSPEGHAPYAVPTLEVYRDMGDLLALDPPMPGLRDIPLHRQTETSGP